MNRALESPVLVGRRRELERLSALLDRAAAGEPVVALVAGEAGVGKSRLIREVARDASRRGLRVLIGGCVELGGEGMTLAPLVDMLRSIARTVPADHLDECFGPARREFARLLPELDPGGATGAAPDGSATQLYEHVHGLLTRLAASRPTLIVVEDLHWADRSTRDLIVFLVQTLRELGVMLLLTYRSDELHRRHPLRPLIVGWERMRAVQRVEIGRFSRAEVAAQLRAIRDDPPPSAFVTVVFERSQGNAFLVEEILAAVDGGADPGDLPPSLRDVLLARTDTVSEDAQRVLRAASASAPRVEERLLEAVAGLGEDRLYPALREVVEHHLLVVDPTGRGYAFRHELTRDAVYDDMLPGERVRLHAVYGAALTGDPALLGDDSAVAATLAHHWYAALDLPRALAASVQAGRQAVTAYAPADALRHLERAMQIWPRVPDAPERTGVPWLRLGLMAADAAWATGELSHGLSIVDQMLADLGPAADPLSRAQAVERRASLLRSLGRDAEAVDELSAALADLPMPVVTTTHAAVLASLANSLMRTNDLAGAARTARRAAGAAAESGATAQQADALATLGLSTGYLGDAAGGLAALREGIALAERQELHDVALRGYITLSDVLEMLGRHAEAADAARVGAALAARLGYARSHGAMVVGNLAEPLMRQGQWRAAMDLMTESLADDPSGVFASTLLLLRSELLLWQGDVAAAERDLREARRQFGTGTDIQFTLPMMFIEACVAGDAPAARRVLAPLAEVPLDGLAVRYVWPLVWLGARVGLPSAGEISAKLPADTPPARGYRALATAEAAGADAGAWQRAVEAVRTADEAYPLCYSLFRLAEAQVAAGFAEAATATARECLALADDLGATVAADIRDLGRRARLHIEPAAPAAPDPQPELRFRLTDREREVLALVAEGHSNGRIATALFISPKTASVHVSNILAKLGVTSRTEAATTAYRHGLLSVAGSIGA
ncbi:AAA family ATPase [Actinoplanes sp. NPDC051343]|uniref:helix-turn-helix transcriptional regulator n=1 Tax=Actinoplanes sp. NPDC051343 TaxID=3363906 RepID=UPI003792E774